MTAPSPIYRELAEALRERLAVIADRALRDSDPQRQLQRLRAVSERIASLQQKLPAPVDPQFAHYLQRCSYDKALAWLDEREGR